MLHGFWRCRYGRYERMGHGREGIGARRRVPGSGPDRVGLVELEGQEVRKEKPAQIEN